MLQRKNSDFFEDCAEITGKIDIMEEAAISSPTHLENGLMQAIFITFPNGVVKVVEISRT